MFAGEHRVPAFLEVRGAGQVDQQGQRFPGDAVLAVVDVEVADGHGELASAIGVFGEQLPQGGLGDLVVVVAQRGPCGTGGNVCGHSTDPSAGRGPEGVHH